MQKTKPTILVSCGETSGDLHASVLVSELRKKIHGARILALGGDRVRAAGAEVLFHIRDYSILGFSEVLTNLPRFFRLESSLKQTLANGVDLFIPVDYPGLNLRLAAFARRTGIPVLYYISPQVWAWGRGRVRKIEKNVDFLALILPFEKGIYHGIETEFVGHPFLEDHLLPNPLPESQRSGVGLLPGSRIQEVQKILPVLLESASVIAGTHRREKFLTGMAPDVPASIYNRLLEGSSLEIELVEDALDVMKKSRVLLVASGTATLQAALLETPLVIVYRVSYLNYLLARRLVTVDNIGLVNIVLADEVCPEFIQGNALPDKIAGAAIKLLEDEESRSRMVGRFRELRNMLSGSGGCRRVAEVARSLLGED